MKHKSKWSRKIQCIPHWTFHIARYEVLMVYLGMLVQDRFAEMCGESSKQECARWNLGVWGFAGVSLGVDLGWVYYGYGLKKCAMSWRSVRQSSKQEYVRWNLGVWGFAGVSLGVDLGWVYYGYGLKKCAMSWRSVRQSSKQEYVRWNLGVWGFAGVSLGVDLGWVCYGLLKCAVRHGNVCRQNSKQEYVRWNV